MLGYNDPWTEYETSSVNRQSLDDLAMTREEYMSILEELTRPLTDTPIGIR